MGQLPDYLRNFVARRFVKALNWERDDGDVRRRSDRQDGCLREQIVNGGVHDSFLM